jgi:hypothetical protein
MNGHMIELSGTNPPTERERIQQDLRVSIRKAERDGDGLRLSYLKELL